MSGEYLPLKAIHHVELLVGNAKQAAYFYRHAFGFSEMNVLIFRTESESGRHIPPATNDAPGSRCR